MTNSEKLSHSKENYCDVREVYDAEIAKLRNEVGRGNIASNHFFLQKMIDALRVAGFKPIKGRSTELELIRICYYLEDNDLLSVVPEWLESAYAENTKFYSQYFKPFDFSSESLGEAEEPYVSSYKAPFVADVKDVKPLRPVEDIGSFDFDEELDKSIDRLKTYRDQQVNEILGQLTSKILTSEYVASTDVVIALSENKLLKQYIGILLAAMKTEIVSTGFNYKDTKVQSLKTSFDAAATYSMEQYKLGVGAALTKMAELQISSDENRRSEQKIRALEAEKRSVSSEHATTRQELENARRSLTIAEARPVIEQARPLNFRISWDEEGVRYYLGTSDYDSISEEGTYRVATLTKSSRKKDSINFENVDAARKQIERAIRYYSKIDRKQLISLVHLQNAYLTVLLEYEDHKSFRRTVPAKSVG